MADKKTVPPIIINIPAPPFLTNATAELDLVGISLITKNRILKGLATGTCIGFGMPRQIIKLLHTYAALPLIHVVLGPTYSRKSLRFSVIGMDHNQHTHAKLEEFSRWLKLGLSVSAPQSQIKMQKPQRSIPDPDSSNVSYDFTILYDRTDIPFAPILRNMMPHAWPIMNYVPAKDDKRVQLLEHVKQLFIEHN
jgi:hypothetical protein